MLTRSCRNPEQDRWSYGVGDADSDRCDEACQIVEGDRAHEGILRLADDGIIRCGPPSIPLCVPVLGPAEK